MALRDCGKLRLFKLGVSNDEYAVVFTDKYTSHVKALLGDTPLCRKFVGSILPMCKDVSITRKQLTEELRVAEEDVV